MTDTHAHDDPRGRLLRQLALHVAAALACPVALYALAGNPLAVTIPNTQAVELWWNITRYNPTYALPLLIHILTDLAWLAWGWHTVWTLAALTWIVLRLRAIAVPHLVLRFAPALAVQALAGTAAAAAATGHTAPAVHINTDLHQAANYETTAQAELVTVQPGDSLWKIAAEHYGQGQDWPEIYQANYDRPEPDNTLLTDPTQIRPGWTLNVHASSPTADQARAEEPAHATPSATPSPAYQPTRTPSHQLSHPHAVGLELPDGGYVGITLAAAIAAASTLLYRRHRVLRSTTAPALAPTAQLLARAANAARAATQLGYQPDEHHGAPPLLNHPHPDPPTLGSQPGDRQETAAHISSGSILSYTGPAAEDAARALVLETLATALQHRGTQRDTPQLIIDQAVAHTLLGITPADSLPDLLTVLDEPFTATLLARAPGRLIAISTADPASAAAFQWAVAERADFTGLLLGPTNGTKTITALDLGEDGRTRTATGPRARDLANTRFHTLPYPAARSLLTVVYEAATPARQPAPAGIPQEEIAARDEPDDPAHRASPATPGTGTERPPCEQKPEPTPAVRPPAEPDSQACPTPLLLRVLGPVAIDGPAGTVPVDSDRSAAILALLALNPAGRSAEAMGEEIWKGKLPEHRPLSPIYAALKRTRDLLAKALDQPPNQPAAEPLITENGRYRLDPNAVTTDLAFQRDLEARAERTSDGATRCRLLGQAARLYRDELAEHLGPDTFEELMIARTEAQIRAQRLHLAAANTAAELGAGHFPEALEHAQAALDIEPADRATAVGAHRVYQQLGRSDLARASRQLHESACTALGLDPAPAAATRNEAPASPPIPHARHRTQPSITSRRP